MDPRFLQEEGTGIFTGNELIVKGGLESGIGLLTGYPGSPVAEVFDAAERIKELLLDKGILVQIANNEALGAARLNGSQMESVRAMAVMKSVGAHVASDALALGNMAGTGPGGAAVAVFGDDTWSEGTQVPADSRFIAKHLYMPILEPSTFQEIKDWIGVAFDLSERSRLFVAYLVTSNQADGGGTVRVRPNRFPDLTTRNPLTLETRSIPVDDRVIIPPHTARKEDEVLYDRFPELLDHARELGVNQILYASDSGRKPIGFVTCSLAYCYLEHVLSLLGLEGQVPILKYGVTHPLDRDILRDFAGQVDELVVVEEKRPFLEEQITFALQAMSQAGEIRPYRVWGKRFSRGRDGLPSSRGFNPSILLQRLAPLFLELDDPRMDIDRGLIREEVALIERIERYEVRAAVRTPSFCPGCPHRDSASVLNRVVDDFMDDAYMQKEHKRQPVDLVFHGDIGCYTLLKYEPFDRLIHNLSGMGLGGGTGAGIDPFITNKQLVFMGDSTFFHSGMAAISDSIKNGQDITYVILDNKTTAMTGHQPTPGVDTDIMGRPTFAQDIEQIVRGMVKSERSGSAVLIRMNPADRSAYRRKVEAALLKDGVKIIIADKECGITYHRRARAEASGVVKQKGFLPREVRINVTPDVCEYCLECTRATGCSGLTVEETLRGPKIVTDFSLCVSDGACTKVTVGGGDRTCPSFEEMTITRRRAPDVLTERIDLSNLPEPEFRDFEKGWYAYVAGVGGMGINTVSAILSVAGAKQGYTVRFTNKKGLAIRNGAVYSHVGFTKGDHPISQLTPYGHADLLLGLDILEAVRALSPGEFGKVASPEHTTAVLETSRRETTMSLTGKEALDIEDMQRMLKKYTNADRYFAVNVSEISERYLGNKIYANSILLGIAYQRAALPLDLENIQWAMRHNIRRDLEPNLKALNIGRKLAIDPGAFETKGPGYETFASFVEDKLRILRRSQGRNVAEAYRRLAHVGEEMDLGEEAKVQFALGTYDVIQWGGVAYARTYVERVRQIYSRDRREYGYEATAAVIHYLARAMAYKDEIYVAHLLTSEEKHRRDRLYYNMDPKRGDRVAYRHFTRPHLRVAGLDLTFNLKTRPWMLKMMRRMKVLRTLLPSWHAEEKAFRDWYVNLVDQFEFEDEERYRAYVRALRLPEEVRGYREVIWPKMEAAYRMAEYLLNGEGEPSAIDAYLDIEPVREPA